MNFLEAIRSAKLGLKIRSINWASHHFIYLDAEDDNSCGFSDQGCIPFLPDYEDLVSSWEIYLEDKPKTYSFQEALKALEEGKKISRPFKLAPGRKRILQKIVKDNGSFIMYADDEKKEHEIYKLDQLSFNYEAIVATDWIIEE